MNDKNKKLVWTAVFAAAIVREFYDDSARLGRGHGIERMSDYIEEAEALADIAIEAMTMTPKGLRD